MLTKIEAHKILHLHLINLKKCLDGAWKAWHDHYKLRHHVLDARARAAIVHCEIIALAHELFDGLADVKIVKRGAMYLIYFGDDIALRFKKLINGRTSNVQTKQQKLLETQKPLKGFLPGTYVTAGYELDQIEQAIKQTLVLAHFNKKPVWGIDLNLSQEGAVEMVSPEFIKKQKATKTRVKAKKTAMLKNAEQKGI